LAVVARRTVYLLLIALLLLTIAVRYPLVEHERNQTDSYFVHYLSQSVVDNGRAKWIFNPLSYLGYYPFSYPSGVPFLLAELSSLTGLSIEASVLLADILTATLFTLAVFVLGRCFLIRPELVLFATFFALLGSRFVDTSYWCGSARGLVVVLATLVVFTTFRASRGGRNRLLLVATLLGVGCFTAHHMAVILVLFGVGYLIAIFQTQFVFQRVGVHKRAAVIACNVLIAVAIAILVFGYLDFFESLGFADFEKTSLFSLNPPILSVLINMAASYTNQIGFILVLAILGIPGLLRHSYLGMETLFPLSLMLAFIPLLGNALYVSMLLSPFVAILGVSAISRYWRYVKRKSFAVFAVAVLAASSLLLPIWSTQRWNEREYPSGEEVEVANQVFNDASYLRENANGASAISNVNVMAVLLAATADTAFLGSGIYMTLSDDIRYEDIQRNITWSNAPFPRNLYNWFEYHQTPDVRLYLLGLIILGLSFINGPQRHLLAADYFTHHPKLIVAVDNARPYQYVDSYSTHPSNFLTEIRSSFSPWGGLEFQSYKFYESGGVTLYLVKLPL
jgi:hypothetical protein